MDPPSFAIKVATFCRHCKPTITHQLFLPKNLLICRSSDNKKQKQMRSHVFPYVPATLEISNSKLSPAPSCWPQFGCRFRPPDNQKSPKRRPRDSRTPPKASKISPRHCHDVGIPTRKHLKPTIQTPITNSIETYARCHCSFRHYWHGPVRTHPPKGGEGGGGGRQVQYFCQTSMAAAVCMNTYTMFCNRCNSHIYIWSILWMLDISIALCICVWEWFVIYTRCCVTAYIMLQPTFSNHMHCIHCIHCILCSMLHLQIDWSIRVLENIGQTALKYWSPRMPA